MAGCNFPGTHATEALTSSSSTPAKHKGQATNKPLCHPDTVGEASTYSSINSKDSTSPKPQESDGNMVSHQMKHTIKSYHEMILNFWPRISEEAIATAPEFADRYQRIMEPALSNFLGARLPLASGLNIMQWREALVGYHDVEICDFLEFGWPVGYIMDRPPTPVLNNHPSALANPSHVKEFLQEKLKFEAMVGPFKSPPFQPWNRTSPIMTRPKKRLR